jgi:hypothetical protein
MIQVLAGELNCRQFVHAYDGTTGSQVCPHVPEAAVQDMLIGGRLRGCGAAFSFDGSVAQTRKHG